MIEIDIKKIVCITILIAIIGSMSLAAGFYLLKDYQQGIFFLVLALINMHLYNKVEKLCE